MSPLNSPELIVCTRCAHIFELPANQENQNIYCPECNHLIHRASSIRLLQYASKMAHYGYVYRTVYEEDIADMEDEEELSVAYSVIPSEMLAFAAVAALSGIIGNASYDLIKIAVQKMAKQLHKRKKPMEELDAVFENEEDFRLMLRYLEAFVKNGMSDADSRVRSAVLGEIVIDSQNPFTLKSDEPIQLGADSFINFWQQVADESIKEQVVQLQHRS